ncbi:TRAFAC type P-loop GTpase that may be related to kinesin [Cryptosporidium ryanae]|uniref:TRAFAC type P-loop GTpase that may be related to kinesin n=1 Tax=Cryptosporidium ryanae TaxID=515981 RepID=UPI00351A6C00|nr:TRAFAC type P-loop GTpase that may be related to kinesin [Cryptosporidium ryanae]
MESSLIGLSKAKSSVRTFIRFSPKKKKEDKEEKWNFVFGRNGRSIRVCRKSELGRTRFCSVTNDIFTEDVCNSEIYRKMGLQQHALDTLDGISTNVIVCGPHKTGKTHTLIGSQRSIGLVLQVVYDIFASIRCYSTGIHLNEKSTNTDIGGNFDRLFVVKASVLEISENSLNYTIDNVRDLINPENPLQLIRKIGGLGYIIKGEPEHLFEKEEKLVSAILYAVSRKKVLDSIRKLKYKGCKKSIPKNIQSSVFGSFGEKWFEDNIVGNLMITITVESADKLEIENKVRKNSNIANSTNVSSGSIKFFEVSSCFNSNMQTKTIIPMFGLLDLAHEIRKYTYTNEKNEKIYITNISSCIASTIVESNLLVLATLTESPNEKKCCIRPILTPYDNQTTVQPNSIFDTIQFIEYIGNSMKFPVFPQRNCFNRPLFQSKLMEILRKKIKSNPKSKPNDKMIIKSDKGIWKTESSGRVTRIIRLLTFINRSSEGSAILRILMSGNDDDILKIYCENIIGSNSINFEDDSMGNNTYKWIKNEDFKDIKKLNKNNFLYDKNVRFEGESDEFTDKKINVNNKETDSGDTLKKTDETNYLENSKIKNLCFSERKEANKDNILKTSAKFADEPNIRIDDLLILEKNETTDESNIDENMTDIFNSKKFEEKEHYYNSLNLNLCEKVKRGKSKSSEKKKISSKLRLDKEIENNKHESTNLAENEILTTKECVKYVDEKVGRTCKSINNVDKGVGRTHKSLDLVDEGVGDTYKSLNVADEEVEVDPNCFNPVKQYEELLEKTKSLNKLQKSIIEAQKKYEKDFLESDFEGNIYEKEIQSRKLKKRFQVVNERALEASQKAVEASKKALEASRNLYGTEKKHSRGEVHEVIPESKNFPRVDIYAPAYYSDVDYEHYHTPGNFRFGVEESNETNYEKNFISKNEINYWKRVKDNNCPCCIDYAKIERCRCHYKDASVNFVGISETSVNTDKSLLQLYEPGAGINEKLKPNGRSWDIIFNLPKENRRLKLGFEKNKDKTMENNLINNEISYLSPSSSVQDIEDIYFESENIYGDEEDEDTNINTKINNKVAFTENMNQINSNNINKTRNFSQMVLDPDIFKPLYSDISENNYPVFNRRFANNKHKNQCNFENKACESKNKNLNCLGCFDSFGGIQKNKSFSYFSDSNLSESKDKLNLVDYSEGPSREIGFENFKMHNKTEINKSYSKFNDNFLEKIEEDIHNQTTQFSNISGKVNTHSEQNDRETSVYINDKASELNNSTDEVNYSNRGIPIEGVIREFGCCHVKYILPFPEELRPKIIRGKQSYTYPYLKSLY